MALAGDSLRFTVEPGLEVWADAGRFDQVVTNLVANAFQHGEPPVEVTARSVAGGVMLTVCDAGPGIPPQHRRDVFDRFWQASRVTARLSSGAGIGLALVAGLVDGHGGSVSISDAAGGGACFEVFLPDGPAPGLG